MRNLIRRRHRLRRPKGPSPTNAKKIKKLLEELIAKMDKDRSGREKKALKKL